MSSLPNPIRSTALALVALAGLSLLSAAAGPRQSKKTNRAAAALAPDKGKFRILVDSQLVGTEEFQIMPADGQNGQAWSARGKTEIHPPGGETSQVSAELQLSPEGRPLRYEWTAQAQKKASATVEFSGNIAKMSLRLEGAQPYVQQLTFNSPRIVVLDNNLYHHYAILARIYDWNARGPQAFPVLIPQDITPGEVTAEAMGPQVVEGATLELLRVRSADLIVDLFLDANHRLIRIGVPESKAVVVRE